MQRFSLQFRDQSVQSVFQRGQSKFVQLSFEPGQGLKKHHTPLALAVIVLTGEIQFTVGDRTEVLHASDMLTLDPGVEHAVEANQRSTVLLVLTPDSASTVKPSSGSRQAINHENAFQRPELIEQIAPELRPLVEDHIELCKVLMSVEQSADIETVHDVLQIIEKELKGHFTVEEQFLFPRTAHHVGGMDVGPVARMLYEHKQIRQLHAEAESLMSASHHGDDNARTLLGDKIAELSHELLNHLGKEDSHLFPMASRLLTQEEKAAVSQGIKEFESRQSES